MCENYVFTAFRRNSVRAVRSLPSQIPSCSSASSAFSLVSKWETSFTSAFSVDRTLHYTTSCSSYSKMNSKGVSDKLSAVDLPLSLSFNVTASYLGFSDHYGLESPFIPSNRILFRRNNSIRSFPVFCFSVFFFNLDFLFWSCFTNPFSVISFPNNFEYFVTTICRKLSFFVFREFSLFVFIDGIWN